MDARAQQILPAGNHNTRFTASPGFPTARPASWLPQPRESSFALLRFAAHIAHRRLCRCHEQRRAHAAARPCERLCARFGSDRLPAEGARPALHIFNFA